MPIHVFNAAYKADASGYFNACQAYGALGGSNRPPPVISCSMVSFVVDIIHALVATLFLTDPSVARMV